MAEVKQTVVLSTTDPNGDAGDLQVRQGDEGTQIWVAQISENGARKPYEGLQPFFCAKLGQSVGLGVIEQKLTEKEQTDPRIGRLEYTVRPEELQRVGHHTGYFSFRKMIDAKNWEEQFSTRDFNFTVLESAFTGGVQEVKNDGSTYIWTIEDMIRLFEAYIKNGTADWEEFVEDNRDIIEAVDPGGKLLAELADARKPYKSVAERFQAIVTDMGKKATQADVQKVATEASQLKEGLVFTPDGTQNSVNYIAHRGNNTDYPENSIRAFESVTRHWGIETDISVTVDGHWVIMHDSTVDRMTNGTGRIADMTYQEIQGLKIDSGKNVSLLTDAERKVPTLDDFLGICKRNGTVPVIEIKKATYVAKDFDLFVDTLRRFNLIQGCVVISYELSALKEVKKRLPTINVQLLINEITDDNLKDAQGLGSNSGISTKYNHSSLSTANIKKAHQMGLSVCAYTVPETSFDTALATGLDFITTNSKSGNRRFADLTPVGKFVANNTNQIATPYIEEKAPGKMQLYFGVEAGSNERFDVFLQLPKWAIPLHNQWNPCTVHIKGGISNDASFDIIGRTAPANSNPGEVRVSYGWENRDTWCHGNVEYTLY